MLARKLAIAALAAALLASFYGGTERAAQMPAATAPAGDSLGAPPAQDAPPAVLLPPPKPAEIAWVTEKQAYAGDKLVYVFLTDAPQCEPCVRQEARQHDPAVIGAAEEFACVSLCWCDPDLRWHMQRDYHVRTFPTDYFLDPQTGKAWFFEGEAKDVSDYVARFQAAAAQLRPPTKTAYDYGLTPLNTEALCRISIEEPGTAGFHPHILGSGTVVDSRGGYGIVLTAKHLFEDGADKYPITVTFPNGDSRRWPGTFMGADPASDLAGVFIADPPAACDVADGDMLAASGFGPPETKLATVFGAPVGKYDTPWMVSMTGVARQGDSGGPVMNAAGQLVGVIYGTADGEIFYTRPRAIREFLSRYNLAQWLEAHRNSNGG